MENPDEYLHGVSAPSTVFISMGKRNRPRSNGAKGGSEGKGNKPSTPFTPSMVASENVPVVGSL